MYSIYNNSKSFSGNNTTMNRISNILELPLTNQIKNKIIGIHAYKFGKLVYDKDIEYILIIGGTDIYIDVLNKEKKEIMIKAMNNAKYVIAFNKFILIRILSLDIKKEKIKIIPQSVSPSKVLFYDLYSFAQTHIPQYKTKKINGIYLMVGNIRPVKDPFFVKKTFEKLSKEGIILLLIGDMIEGNFQFGEGMYHVGPLNQSIISSFYSQADGLINSSKSEGMAVSILEAMINGCIVYARNIEGNIAIVDHEINGYIFNTDDELYNIIKKKKNSLQTIDIAKKYVTSYHNNFIEGIHYESILN